jgi:lipopolysaccharide/colanic/teichoic acid biosynthesis glycosyltransferase
VFDLLKFRSMEVNDDSDTTWDVECDPRVTPVGGFLRRTCLDELPQLWNVFRGDMSIVGPRPERPHFAELFGASVPGYSDRSRVAAGLTGWSQIHGLRGDTSIVERAAFDNYYVENWSLWLDLRVIVRTVRAMAAARTTAAT